MIKRDFLLEIKARAVSCAVYLVEQKVFVTLGDEFNITNMLKLSYFGHIKRHNILEKLFLEGTCEGRRGRGRPRRRRTQDIGEWMGVSTVEAGRQALERGEFCQAVWEATSINDPPWKKKNMLN